MKRPANSRTERVGGFTLLELTVALAASAVVLSAIFGIFSRAIHLRDNATERTRDARVRLRAANVIRNDLRNAYISGNTGVTLAATLEGSEESHGASFPGYLKFTTTTTPDDADDPSADVQQVEYYIVNDPNAVGTKTGLLVRATTRDLLATVREQAPEETLLADVASMEVSFYDGTEWKESWAFSDDNKTLPTAVRVRLKTTLNTAPIEVLVPWTAQLKD